MSNMSEIQAALSQAMSDNFADSNVVEYRQLKNNPNAAKREWSEWLPLTGARTTNYAVEQTRSEKTGNWFRNESCDLRVPSTLVIIAANGDTGSLTITSQIRLNSKKIYQLKSGIPQGTSVLLYKIVNSTPLLGDPRDGGV